MVYQPVPLGIQSMASTGYGGGGLCSAKLTPYDEWKSACFDYDFFDGSGGSEGRVPPGPESWFSALWERDLPVLKELGVNTLRLYSLNPLTLAASENRVGTEGIVHAYGKSHVEFFDACEEAGLKVFAPLVSVEANVLANQERSEWEKGVSALIEELGSHPALLGWYIGSDWGLESASQETLVSTVNQVIEYAKTVSNDLGHPSSSLFTHCISNLPNTAQFFTEHLDLDFLCANAGWEGPEGLQEFIHPANGSDASSWASLAKNKGWPIVIGEMGTVITNTSENEANSEWFNEIWKNTLDLSSSGVVGAFFFEYVDHPFEALEWKRELGATYLETAKDGILNSTQENIFWADTLLQKPIIFDAIKEGSFNQQSINYNTDVWQYLGRDPETISTPQSTSQPSSSNPITIPHITLLSISTFIVAFIIG